MGGGSASRSPARWRPFTPAPPPPSSPVRRDEAGTSGTALAQAHKDLKQKEGELADVKRALAHLRDSQLPEEKGQRYAGAMCTGGGRGGGRGG